MTPRKLSTELAIALPILCAAALVSLTMVPYLGSDAGISRAFLGAAAALAVLAVIVYARVRTSGRALELEVALKTPHYVQAGAQLSLLVYWGVFVTAVFANVPLVLGQLIFAYGLDMLLQWSRRDRYVLGVGPLPIVLSINFFLWFRPEHYHWQFLIVALGYFAKEFVHWERDGRSRHIFNPSSFPLSVFSLVLIATGTTDLTFGLEIAQSLFNPPFIYLVVFLVAIPGQVLFGVTTMTLASVATAYIWSLAYFFATGTFFFRDAYIPIAVFLGMHLLFTDPATSPKSELGRVIFGVLYASFTIALAGLLDAIGAPTFYDKLLPIPILNLMVRRIEATADVLRPMLGSLGQWGAGLTARGYRLTVVGAWVVIFGGMSAAGGVGDDHPGQYLPFWIAACAETGRESACEYVAFVEQTYCERGSAWACNELGVNRALYAMDEAAARFEFERACAAGSAPACANQLALATGSNDFVRPPPPDDELRIVIRGSKGPILESDPAVLREIACERGWTELCAGA